ncbi:MAG: response regulator transcription factor [Candidatus Solibacter sp.]|nr:response regulator transcription factor [Candidatus Solibacter sp.]
MAVPDALKVGIIEDQPKIREGLRSLIDGTEGYRCVGSFGSVEDALAKIDGELPDVLLMDIGLPGMSGIEGTRRIKKLHPGLTVLMLTVYDDDQRIFDALCAGASGYLLKKTPPARLLEGLKEAVGSGAPMSPDVARRVVSLFRQIRPPAEADYRLTPHEIRILGLLVEGHNYKTAADELRVSINTIRFHMRSIYEKLQVHSKSEAVSKALRHRIVR